MQSSSCDKYYNFIKPWIVSAIPDGPNVVLDLGCGTGRLGRKLRDLNKASELIGVEIFKSAADEAAKYYDRVYSGDAEELSLNYEDHFDFVICGDILEHLRDPQKLLVKIHGWLKNSGNIIVSIPNIRYWRILRDLILSDEFEYKDAGILDITHLRFFTRKSFISLLTHCKFDIVHQEMDIAGKRHNLFNKLTFSLFEGFLGSQIKITAKKSGTENTVDSSRER
jgi:2-polyprenyl-3-methyl-5-hydroxy-6-metoxy-1,4-benzoquinol methylase